MLEQIKEYVCEANQSLARLGLVKWTSGNVSARSDDDLVVIKPSGVQFTELTPVQMVVVDIEGRVIEGGLKPSVDTASHLYVYRNMPNVNAIVHTHSPFATSFAIRGQSIPAYTTTAAYMFGEEVPVSSYAAIGEEDIGRQIVSAIGDCSAILLRSHGVFTIGKSVEAALKAAVILEETAEYAHYALLHEPDLKPLEADIVSSLQRFIETSYGQNT